MNNLESRTIKYLGNIEIHFKKLNWNANKIVLIYNLFLSRSLQ